MDTLVQAKPCLDKTESLVFQDYLQRPAHLLQTQPGAEYLNITHNKNIMQFEVKNRTKPLKEKVDAIYTPSDYTEFPTH